MRTMEAEVRIQSKSDLILPPLYQEILSQGNISQYIHCGGGNTSLQYNNFPERMGNTPPSDHEISQGRGFCIPREISQSSGDVFLCSRQCTERIQYIPTLGSAVPYSHCLIITPSLGMHKIQPKWQVVLFALLKSQLMSLVMMREWVMSICDL